MFGSEIEHRLGPVLRGQCPADQGGAGGGREPPTPIVVTGGELRLDAQQPLGEGEGRMRGEDDAEGRPLHRRPEGLEGRRDPALGVAGEIHDQPTHDPRIGGRIGFADAGGQAFGAGQESIGGQALDQLLDVGERHLSRVDAATQAQRQEMDRVAERVGIAGGAQGLELMAHLAVEDGVSDSGAGRKQGHSLGRQGGAGPGQHRLQLGAQPAAGLGCAAHGPSSARNAPMSASVCSGRPTEMRMQLSSPGLS